MTHQPLGSRALLFRIALVLLWLVPIDAARAGSVTADSINSREAARQAAIQQMPRGATVLRSHCQDIQVGAFGPPRYRCTVWFSPAAAPAPASKVTAPEKSAPEPIPASVQPAADIPGAPASEVTAPGATPAP